MLIRECIVPYLEEDPARFGKLPRKFINMVFPGEMFIQKYA